MNNIKKLIKKYESIRPKYQLLVDEVIFILESELKKLNIKVEGISGRTKEISSLREKIERKLYSDNHLEQVTDLAGVRIVCYYEYDLPKVDSIIRKKFKLIEYIDKTGDLGVDKMGYHGSHFIVSLGNKYQGARYDGLTFLNCEIQIRTVLQDAWALISHHLIYKDESSIPIRIRRDLNNVASLLEVAQGIFDTIRNKRESYLGEIHEKENIESEFLGQPIDYDTLVAYINYKFPGYEIEDYWHTKFISDLNHERYKTLKDIDEVVNCAKPAVDVFKSEYPEMFTGGTDFLTKSFGFLDEEFRKKHDWASVTFDSFKRLGHLVRKRNTEQCN